MCFQLIELFAVCGCVYWKHAVDQCPRANQRGHTVERREVSVGYACALHSAQGKTNDNSSGGGGNTSTAQWPDSGYSSSGYYAGEQFRS